MFEKSVKGGRIFILKMIIWTGFILLPSLFFLSLWAGLIVMVMLGEYKAGIRLPDTLLTKLKNNLTKSKSML